MRAKGGSRRCARLILLVIGPTQFGNRNGGTIFFFDEANAVFGKRSEIKDSHDRYANIEINYLLQRQDELEGIAILARCRRENFDAAFLHRFKWIVYLGKK